MLKRFLPRQEGFFKFFQLSADIIENTTARFHAMLHDLSNQENYVNAIAQYEEEGDHIAHQTFELLHKTFITPFDRHDIHNLTSGLDDILDNINRCAQRFPFYHLENLPSEFIQLAELNVRASQLLKKAIYQLNSLKHATEIFNWCESIDAIESEAHRTVLAGEKDLFLKENDFKHFFKLKEIYALTKLVTNSLQDAGNVIKGIVLEYS